jgi:hypothetical protein
VNFTLLNKIWISKFLVHMPFDIRISDKTLVGILSKKESRHLGTLLAFQNNAGNKIILEIELQRSTFY